MKFHSITVSANLTSGINSTTITPFLGPVNISDFEIMSIKYAHSSSSHFTCMTVQVMNQSQEPQIGDTKAWVELDSAVALIPSAFSNSIVITKPFTNAYGWLRLSGKSVDISGSPQVSLTIGGFRRE